MIGDDFVLTPWAPREPGRTDRTAAERQRRCRITKRYADGYEETERVERLLMAEDMRRRRTRMGWRW